MSQNGAASLADIHHAIGISRPAILRLLATLEEEGFIRRWLGDGLYRINTLSPVSSRSTAWLSLVADTIAPSMSRLTQKIGWPVDVAILDGDKMAVCETTRRQSPFPVKIISSGYQVHILQSAVGRAYLSFIGESERKMLLNRLVASSDPYDSGARSTREVEMMVRSVQEKGYAERALGYSARKIADAGHMHAVGVPVLQEGGVAACLSVTWTASYLGIEEFAAKHIGDMLDAASDAAVLLDAARNKVLE